MANELIDEIFFNGGIDADSDDKFVQQGDYVDALNIGKFYDGDAGVVTNINGNSEISNTYLPVGTNKCIGWCPDDENNAIIFFNYNSNSNHGIYRMLKDSDTFQKIIDSKSILGFKSDCTNLQAYVVGGLLYWNEGKDSSDAYINVPRKLNIEKARRYTNSLGGDDYTDITDYVLSVIKPPYLGYLNISFTDDTTYTGVSNFINKKYYKVAMQLIYDDDEASVIGNFSNIAAYENTDHNCLAIRFYYQSFTDTVQKIKIFYQENFVGATLFVDEIDVSTPSGVYDSTDEQLLGSSMSSGNYYVYRWYGISSGGAYDGSTNIYDSVPLYANSMLLTGDRLFYGDVIPTKDVSDDALDYSVISATDSDIYDSSAFVGTYGSDVGGAAFTIPIIPILTDFIPGNSNHFSQIYFVQSVSVVGGTYFGLDIKIDCDNVCPYWDEDRMMEYIVANTEVWGIRRTDSVRVDGVVSYSESGGVYTLKGYLAGSDSNVSSGSNTHNILRYSKANTLSYKSGSRRSIATVYYDIYGRTLGYVMDGGETEYTPLKSSNTVDGIFGYTTNIGSLAQDVAYVSIVASDNLDWVKVQWVSSATYSAPNQTFEIPSNYVYQEGDVVRLGESGLIWKILNADADYLYFDDDFDYTSGSYEILTARSTESVLFYEVKSFTVGQGILPEYGSTNGDVILSDGDIASTIDLLSGVIYGIEGFTDYDGNNIYYSGRPFVEKQDFDQNEFQDIYFSNKYFDNTNINGLSTFVSGNRVNLSDDDGDIIDLKRIGEVIYAIQRREITSFYLGKTILKQSSTGEVTADTSQILGGKRESSFDYGSVFSTAKMDNLLYGFDIYKGVFWINGYNGVNIISGKDVSGNYKMDTYFKEKSKALLASGISNVDVAIGSDKSNETIYVTFIDSNTPANNETIAYHKPTNRWISKYSFIPEEYAWLDDKFYSLNDGKLYEHNDSSALKCNFYGTQYESYIQFVTHSIPSAIKIFNSISIHADSQWTVETVEGDANSNYTNGFYSKIPDANFVRDEGVWRSEFMRNMKTRSSVATNYDLINGEECRAYVVKIKLTNDETTKTELFKVDINSMISK